MIPSLYRKVVLYLVLKCQKTRRCFPEHQAVTLAVKMVLRYLDIEDPFILVTSIVLRETTPTILVMTDEPVLIE